MIARRNPFPGCAAVARTATAVPVILALVAGSLAADEPARSPIPDVRLPFRPVDPRAAEGDWALYRVTDPEHPASELPAERFVVTAADATSLTAVDAAQDVFRFPLGEDGMSATAFLRAFLGVQAGAGNRASAPARADAIRNLSALAVVKDPVDLFGSHYDAARIDATYAISLAQDGGRPAGDVRTALKIWIAPGLHVHGIVKADATVEFGGSKHRGVLELFAHGTKADRPPGRMPQDGPGAPSGTAAAAPSGTAAPK